ncbi:uncharacterized protein G2W53_034687 [Senna tora]|uniref:Uncharacterized protein n=1 Tax=Senna tora TaxID=362788 RepID=A0A834WC50_9FABA|nr:uncharacterized protein G2W53_034687 [Senna tora]
MALHLLIKGCVIAYGLRLRGIEEAHSHSRTQLP